VPMPGNLLPTTLRAALTAQKGENGPLPTLKQRSNRKKLFPKDGPTPYTRRRQDEGGSQPSKPGVLCASW
jgi:hypothetical protein